MDKEYIQSLTFFLSIIKTNISSNHEHCNRITIQEKDDPKTFSLTLTGEQRKYLMYTGVALLGYFLAKRLVKSAVKSLKDNEE